MATTQVIPQVTESMGVDAIEAAEYDAGRRRLHPLAGYFARRIGLYLLTLWGAFTASFLFFRLIPGDPISIMVSELARQGQYSTDAASQAIVDYYRTAFGLDGNLFEQYVRYMNQLIVHRDFGPSIISYPTPASDLIMRSLPWTLGLLGVATILGWIIGVIAGTFVGRARSSRLANAITNVSLLVTNIPSYFVALFLVFIFAYRVRIFPPNSAYDASLTLELSWPVIVSLVQHAALPVLATLIVTATGWIITTRALVINVLGEDYLTFAEAKGLSSWRILNMYVMRNAWLPQIAALGIALGSVVNGNILIERLFRYPGVGNLFIEAIGRKDVNTAQGIITVLIFGVLTFNLIIDLLLPLFDPRIRHAR